jgi:hypothetical protein
MEIKPHKDFRWIVAGPEMLGCKPGNQGTLTSFPIKPSAP